MPLSRRTLLTTTAALAVLPAAPACAAEAAPEPDLATPQGWLDWITAHRDRIALAARDTAGMRLEHRAAAAQPAASAVKVAHLAAYATAVADGVLDPREQVRVADWERYYVPTDGGAHAAALADCGIPADASGLYAADPQRRVALEQLAAAMILRSDSAAPDYLRVRLGVERVRRAAEAGGWARPDLRSLCGEYLLLLLPAEESSPRSRRERGFALEQRFSTDQALRDHVRDRVLRGQLPPYPVQAAWAAGGAAASPWNLAALHGSIAEGRNMPERAAAIARDLLERPLRGHEPTGVAGIGYKGGSLPGVLAAGLTVRRTDGRVFSGSLLAHGPISPAQLAKGDPGVPLLHAALDAGYRARLERALAG